MKLRLLSCASRMFALLLVGGGLLVPGVFALGSDEDSGETFSESSDSGNAESNFDTFEETDEPLVEPTPSGDVWSGDEFLDTGSSDKNSETGEDGE